MGMVPKLGILAAAFATGTLLAAPGTFAGRRLQSPGVIHVTDREIQLARVDVGRKGVSVGDMLIVRFLLYNKRITAKPIGHAELVCTLTSATTSNCSGTYFLPQGKIVV